MIGRIFYTALLGAIFVAATTAGAHAGAAVPRDVLETLEPSFYTVGKAPAPPADETWSYGVEEERLAYDSAYCPTMQGACIRLGPTRW